MNHLSLITAIMLLASSGAAIANQPSPRQVFEQLKSLEGNWRSTSGKTTANYRLVAAGSAIVETWTMSPTRQSMTVYTMDGDGILATHYCPQGNAPRLQWTRTGEDGTHYFMFLDGANLQNMEGFHEHAFWIRSDQPDLLSRSESYIANGSVYDPAEDPGDSESFERVK